MSPVCSGVEVRILIMESQGHKAEVVIVQAANGNRLTDLHNFEQHGS